MRTRRVYRSIGESDTGYKPPVPLVVIVVVVVVIVCLASLCRVTEASMFLWYMCITRYRTQLKGRWMSRSRSTSLHTLLYTVMSYHGQGVTSRDQLRSTESSRGSDTRIPSYKLLLGITLC